MSTLFSMYECFACVMHIATLACLVAMEGRQKTVLDPLEMEWTDGSYLPCGLWVLNLDLLQA